MGPLKICVEKKALTIHLSQAAKCACCSLLGRVGAARRRLQHGGCTFCPPRPIQGRPAFNPQLQKLQLLCLTAVLCWCSQLPCPGLAAARQLLDFLYGVGVGDREDIFIVLWRYNEVKIKNGINKQVSLWKKWHCIIIIQWFLVKCYL